MTNNFKEACKEMAYANRLGKIIYGPEENDFISNDDYLVGFETLDDCYVDGTIIGTTNAKSIKINTLDTYELADGEISAQIGVKYDDESTEYINMGNFIIDRENNHETVQNGEYDGMDYFGKLDDEYTCGITDYETTQITIADVYQDLCNSLGLVPKTLEFLNNDFPVYGNPFTNKEKFRDVLSDIAEIACSWAEIDKDTGEIDLVWFDDELSETFTKDDYATLTLNKKFGPVNSVAIKESQIEGENVVMEDEESLLENDKCQIAIQDNYFLYTEDLRRQIIPSIYQRLNGFTYYDCSIETDLGRPFLKCGNKVSIEDNDGNYFQTYVLKHTFKYDGAFHSTIESPALTEAETRIENNYETPKTKFRRVEIEVDKINGRIDSVIEDSEENFAKVTQDITGVVTNVQNSGGSNLLKNSVMFAKENINISTPIDIYRDYIIPNYSFQSSFDIVILDIDIPTEGNVINLRIPEHEENKDNYLIAINDKKLNVTDNSSNLLTWKELSGQYITIYYSTNSSGSIVGYKYDSELKKYGLKTGDIYLGDIDATFGFKQGIGSVIVMSTVTFNDLVLENGQIIYGNIPSPSLPSISTAGTLLTLNANDNLLIDENENNILFNDIKDKYVELTYTEDESNFICKELEEDESPTSTNSVISTPVNWELSEEGTLDMASSPEAMNAGSISAHVFTLNGMTAKQRINVKLDDDTIPEEQKTYYTFSTKIKKDVTGTCYVKIYNSNEEYIIELGEGEDSYYGDYEIKGLLPKVNYYDVEFYGSEGSNATFTDNMFALGQYTTQWQQASGEIMNTQVSIDVNGISVQSSVYEGNETVITPLEFAGYAIVNGVKTKVFSLNNDTTEVEKIKVRGKIDMPPLKIVPITTGNRKGWAFVPTSGDN